MPTRAQLTPLARRELIEAIRWIAADSPRAARALRDGVAAVARLIGEHPTAGAARPDIVSEPYRMLVVRGFPYLVVSNPERRPPSIVRIVHGARDLPEVLKDL